MKTGSSLVRLLTIFLAIIGLNAATLVGFILLYPTINGEFTPHNSDVISSGITSASENDYEADAFLSTNSTNYLSPEYSEENNTDNTSEPYPVTGYDPAKQNIFEDLQDRNDYTNSTSPQSGNDVWYGEENYILDQRIKQPASTTIQETEPSPEPQIITESISQPVTIPDSQPDNFSVPESEIQRYIPADEMVWLSATGDKYHRINNCGNMNPNKARQVSPEYALSQNFKMCHNCYSANIADTFDYSVSDNITSIQQNDISPAQQDNNFSAESNTINYYLTSNGRHEYFHLSTDCKFVISAGNYTSISGFKEELISRGYIILFLTV